VGDSKSDPSSDLQNPKDQWITRVLGVALPRSGTTAPPSPGIDIALLEKARQTWLATQQNVRNDVAALQKTIEVTYADRGLAPQLKSAYKTNVTAAIALLDEDLTAALDRLLASDPGSPRWETSLDAARDAVDDLAAFIAGNRVIAGLDANPFGVPISVKSTLTSSLKAIANILG
jgi:hypothetical protein